MTMTTVRIPSTDVVPHCIYQNTVTETLDLSFVITQSQYTTKHTQYLRDFPLHVMV